MTSWKRKLLWATWFVSFAVALGSMAIFAQGILRDSRAGEPVVHIDLSSAADWVAVPFRVWGAGTYSFFISSVNHDSRFVGVPLAGDFEVAIMDPDGKVFFQQVYPAGSTDHVLPSNYGDSKLNTFELDDWPFRRWILKARVLKPDPRFKTANTEVKLWKNRYDPGMGGLVNYVMIIPAGVFLVLALITSLALAAKGSKAPLLATLICGVILLAIFIA